MGIWDIVCIQKPHHHFLQTLRPLRMFKIVLHNSSLYLKQLSLFCLLRLISASVDRNDYITNFCSMIEMLHELKTAVFNIEAFRYLILSQQGKFNPAVQGLRRATNNISLKCCMYIPTSVPT